MNSLYDFPKVVDAVLQRPDETVAAEVDSILALLARHDMAGDARVLELACGACAHGIPLSRRGCRVTGIDCSAAMLAEARRRARAAAVDLRTVEGDVVDFDLGESGFDAAIFMFETFPLIAELDDLESHFEAVRRHVRAGGIYVVDVDVSKHGIRCEPGEWGRRTVRLPDGEVELWYEDLPGDWMRGVNRLVLHCRIRLGERRVETRDDWRVRAYTPWELDLLARALEGWKLDGFYSWRDLSADISEETHYFAVFLAV